MIAQAAPIVGPELDISVRSFLDPKSFSSHLVLATGGAAMEQTFRDKNIGIVSVTTDDAEWPLAFLLRNDEERYVRIGVVGYQRGGRVRATVVSIQRNRITNLGVRG